MTDARKVTKEKVRELREFFERELPEPFDFIVGRETASDLLLILSRYEAALPLIEAAMGATVFIHTHSRGDDGEGHSFCDADNRAILRAALKLREKEGEK